MAFTAASNGCRAAVSWARIASDCVRSCCSSDGLGGSGMLEGKNSAELTNLIGSGNPNTDALKYINPALLRNEAIFPNAAVQAKLEQLKDLTAAQRRLRGKMWTEIKASR